MSRGAADGGNGARLGLVSSLPTNERRVLAALAVVGQASLSADELAAVAEVDEVVSAIDDLRARGLLERADGERYSLVGSVGKEIRDTDAALATADRLSGYVMTLAKAGELTPERLVEETEAILGLTEWAAEHEEWRTVLWLAGVAAAGTAGLAAGLAIPSGGANIGTTTERVNVTIRLNGQPVTTTKLVTLPAQTVTTTITTTTTVTPSVG